MHRFYDVAAMTRLGMRVLIEDQSTNCGANAAETRRVLERNGVMHVGSMVVVQDPTMSLRTKAAFEKVYEDVVPGVEVRCCPTFVPRVRVEEGGEVVWDMEGLEAGSLWEMERFLDLLMGEVPRLRDEEGGYGPRGKGFITHVDVPREVEEAWELLKAVLGNKR